MINLIASGRKYYIYQFPDNQSIPEGFYSSDFCSVTKTGDEVSVVTDSLIQTGARSSGKIWRAFKVEGILDFELIGILNDIISPLKASGISVFVLSTFNTDYVFVQDEVFERAKQVLSYSDKIKIINFRLK